MATSPLGAYRQNASIVGSARGLTVEQQLMARMEQLFTILSGAFTTPDSGDPSASDDLSWATAADCVLDPPPSRVVLLTGGQDAVADVACGQLTGRVASLTPVYRPNRSGRLICDVIYWNCTIEVKLFRCVATLSTSGAIPTAAQVQDDGVQQANDMGTMMRAFLAMPWITEAGAWTPLPNQGGAGGGSWTITTPLDALPC